MIMPIKITEVTFSRTFFKGNDLEQYEKEEISATASVEEGDDPMKVLRRLKKFVKASAPVGHPIHDVER